MPPLKSYPCAASALGGKPRPRKGFALIIALSLMAFIMLLIISLSSMIRLETLNASNMRERQIAQQNALLGLQIAIGQIQRHSGSDTRVTGTAQLLDTDPSTPAADDVNEPFWTGVWDASGNLVTWLVSGNEGLTPADGDFLGPSSAFDDAVSMINDESVHVPLRRIDDQNAYAYWVSDEGVKAKVTIPEPQNVAQALLSAQKVDISLMDEMAWTERLPAARRLILPDVETLKLVGNSVERVAVDTHQHNLTASSYGLLTNSATGGLKKDLTLGIFDNSTMPAGRIFDPLDGSASNADPGGPLWTQLQSWATFFPGTDGELSVRPQTDTQTGVFPVITQLQVYVLPRYGPAPDYRLYLDLLPAVTLWNPYDKPLESTDYRLDFGRAFRVTGSNSPYLYDTLLGNWKIRINGSSQIKILDTPNVPNSVIFAGLSFTLSNVSLEPGESLTYGAPLGNQPLDVFNKSNTPTGAQNRLESGFRPTSSYTIDTGRNLSDFSETGSFSFELYANISTTKAMRLVNASDGSVLYETVYLAGDSTAPAAAQMQAAGGPIFSRDGSVGMKFVRNFVDLNSDASVQWAAHLNPRAAMQGPNPLHFHDKNQAELEGSNYSNPSFYPSLDINGLDMSYGMPVSGANTGSGYSVNPNGPRDTVMFETSPGRSGLQSIGQLMHAPIYYSGVPAGDDLTQNRYRLEWGRFDNLLPAYAIGNSLADPSIPLDELYIDWTDYPPASGFGYSYNNIKGRHYDYSYLLNDALWDNYFFSALPSPTSRHSPNARLVALAPEDTSAMSSATVAENFLLNGAFNVNSTSEQAWRAILAAFFGERAQTDQFEGSPFLRVYGAPGQVFDPDAHDEDEEPAYHGYRVLTQAQIANLARQIVKQVKWRGPFTGLSAFVNRQPSEDAPAGLPVNALRLRGALSAAIAAADEISPAEAAELGIDADEARINAALQSDDVETDPWTEPGFIVEAQEGWRTEAVPGWLTQADLLARLGGSLLARSDTFKIIAYGEATDPFTGSKSQAWCEAVVQRMPPFIDAREPAETPLSDLTQQANIDFGRRYVLVSFRWLGDA
jgi:hypothetical protein